MQQTKVSGGGKKENKNQLARDANGEALVRGSYHPPKTTGGNNLGGKKSSLLEQVTLPEAKHKII